MKEIFEKEIWSIFDKHNIGKHEDEGCVPAADEIAQKMNKLRNQLCLMCGNYKQKYAGTCHGCEWHKSVDL